MSWLRFNAVMNDEHKAGVLMAVIETIIDDCTLHPTFGKCGPLAVEKEGSDFMVSCGNNCSNDTDRTELGDAIQAECDKAFYDGTWVSGPTLEKGTCTYDEEPPRTPMTVSPY